MRTNLATRTVQIQQILTVANNKAEQQDRKLNQRIVSKLIGGRTKSFVVGISAAASDCFKQYGEVWLCFPSHAPGMVLIHDPLSIIPRRWRKFVSLFSPFFVFYSFLIKKSDYRITLFLGECNVSFEKIIYKYLFRLA